MSSSSAGFAGVCDFVNCVLALFACFDVIGFNSVVIFNSLLIRVGGVSDLLGFIVGCCILVCCLLVISVICTSLVTLISLCLCLGC